MRRSLLVFIAPAFLLSGCIQLEMLLKVKKDGSGTFAETVLFDVSVLEDLLKRLPQQGGSPTARPWDVNQKELEAAAAKKGKGVKFATAAPVVRGNFKGYTANYTFDDVRNVSIDPDPGKHAPGPKDTPKDQRSDPMHFDFKKGRTSELIVKVPQEEEGKKKDADKKKVDPNDESFEMIRGFLKDMKVVIQVEVDGKVESSNAKFREGNRVTLMALDFNGLIGDTAKLSEVMNAGGYEEAAKAFNAIPGMKMETQKAVRIAFK